jgi:hypothetical protein
VVHDDVVVHDETDDDDAAHAPGEGRASRRNPGRAASSYLSRTARETERETERQTHLTASVHFVATIDR